MQTAYTFAESSGPCPRIPARQQPDAALLASIAQGDRRAMQLLFGRHNVRVFRFMTRITGNEAMAEDLVSEVFVDVWRQAASFKGQSQVGTWVLGIARHKAVSALRRRSHVYVNGDAAASVADTADGPEVTLQHKNRSELMQKCLARLSPAHREVIDLVYYHEKSVDEVATIVGVPPGTVKTRTFHARQKLAVLLQAEGVDRLSAC
jgi:RNA polymerase sigma-70 factor (ECF subfamily)